ncbi:MAG: stage V sporulation protein S [Ruminiclostridium sp.]|nr:stage V sporulation protein S [Ruminiclostridium sp.]
MEIVKVSARSVPKSVAGAIAAVIREKNEVEVQAVGAGALNQAVKSIAIARSYMALTGVDIVCIPAFTTVDIEGEERTAMKFVVEVR